MPGTSRRTRTRWRSRSSAASWWQARRATCRPPRAVTFPALAGCNSRNHARARVTDVRARGTLGHDHRSAFRPDAPPSARDHRRPRRPAARAGRARAPCPTRATSSRASRSTAPRPTSRASAGWTSRATARAGSSTCAATTSSSRGSSTAAWQPPERIDSTIADRELAAGHRGRRRRSPRRRVRLGRHGLHGRAAGRRPAVHAPRRRSPAVRATPTSTCRSTASRTCRSASRAVAATTCFVARKERDATAFGVVPGVVDVDSGARGGHRHRPLADRRRRRRRRARRLGRGRRTCTRAASSRPPVAGPAGPHAGVLRGPRRRRRRRARRRRRGRLELRLGGLPPVVRERRGRRDTRAIARRLLGSQFEAPQAVDGSAFPLPDSVGAAARGTERQGGRLRDERDDGDRVRLRAQGRRLRRRASRSAPGRRTPCLPVAAVDESGDGVDRLAGRRRTIHARAYDNIPASRTPQAPLGEVALALPGGGPTDAASGLEADSDRVGDMAIALRPGHARRALDRRRRASTAGRARSASARGARRGATSPSTPLRWSAAFDLWGPITYTVEVDGRNVAQTTNTARHAARAARRHPPLARDRHRPPRPDRRTTGAAPLRHDDRAPRARISVSGTRAATGRCGSACGPSTPTRAGGARRGHPPGDGGLRRRGADDLDAYAAHRYRRAGRYTIRATVRDRANNVTIVRKRIRIR